METPSEIMRSPLVPTANLETDVGYRQAISRAMSALPVVLERLTSESAAQETRVTRLPPRGSHADRLAWVQGCAAMRSAASAGRAQGGRARRRPEQPHGGRGSGRNGRLLGTIQLRL